VNAHLDEIADVESVIVQCRVCGCTDDDCSQCIERTGQPCAWVEPWREGVTNLCTACVL
jgi:hypothetical protein